MSVLSSNKEGAVAGSWLPAGSARNLARCEFAVACTVRTRLFARPPQETIGPDDQEMNLVRFAS